MNIKNRIEDKIARLEEMIRSIVGGWVEAGKLLVELIDEDPNATDILMQRNPGLSPGVLAQLEAVGRGVLNERLLTMNGPGPMALRRMPYSAQGRLLDEPVELVVETDHGTDILLVAAINLTKKQASQVFAMDHVRTQGQQKAWLLAQKQSRNKGSFAARPKAWEIKGGRVIFNEGASLTAGELATIITQLTR